MAAFILPALLVVAALLVGPIILLGKISLNIYSPSQLMIEVVTLQNYVNAVTSPYYRGVMYTTVSVAFLSTLITLLLGFPAAYRLARLDSKWKSALTIATLLPLVVGNVVRAMGWMGLFGHEGLFNVILLKLGIIHKPLDLIFNSTAVVVGVIAVVLPYMILTLASVIESIPRALEESASNLGASGFTVFRRVVWPLALPGTIAGSVLVFILCMNTYATAVLLGGSNFKMMSPAIYDQFSKSMNWPFGAALAFILLAATLTLTLIGTSLIARRFRPATN